MAKKPTSLRIAVIAWDVCHNAVGRAFMLADLLRRRYRVEICGARFRRYGGRVWPPIAGEQIGIRSFAGADFPAHLERMRKFAAGIDADLLLVSKPRLPALALAALACRERPRPVILDIDDWEAAFFPEQTPLDREKLRARFCQPDARLPYGESWTRYCEGAISDFPFRTVSSRLLQEKFGGMVLPHLRDERVFDPARLRREEARHAFGFSSRDRVVLFVGTPRRHKGLLEVRDALVELKDPRAKLCLFGNITDVKLLFSLLKSPPGLVRLFPGQPFSELPRLLVLADAVCLMQEADHPVTRFQTPAKLTDALAMGVPVLASPVGPLEELCRRGLAVAVEDGKLADRLAELFADLPAARLRAEKLREVFLDEFSYRAHEKPLAELVEKALCHRGPPPGGELLQTVEEAFERKQNRAKRAKSAFSAPPADGLEMVFFWKQNDGFLYGRRLDMLAKYFSQSRRVWRLVHFDAPLGLARLAWEVMRSRGPHQGRLVAQNSLRRAFGKREGEKLVAYTPLGLDPSQGGWLGAFLGAGERSFARFVAGRLRAAGIEPRRAVFYVCPTYYRYPDLWRRLRPALSVADLIDDQRSFYPPGSRRARLVESNLERILQVSDLVLANCRALAQTAASMGKSCVLVPNGVELGHPVDDLPAPPDLMAIAPPRLGYAGNLSSRLDVELLDRLAAARLGSVVLIGSAHLDRRVLDLRRHPNVHFLGVRPYPQVRRYIKHFDVALLPHTSDRLTESMHPLKLPLYLALGVPVVSTDIENLGDLRDFITVAQTREDFIAAVKRAIASGRPQRNEGVFEKLAEYDWGKKAEFILDLIEERLCR